MGCGDPAPELGEAGWGPLVVVFPSVPPSETPLFMSFPCELGRAEGSVSACLLGLWDLGT